MVSTSVSALRAVGGGALAASATGSTVSASPSKNRVIAIYQSDRQLWNCLSKEDRELPVHSTDTFAEVVWLHRVADL